MIQKLNEEETRFFKENGPIEIPFGGNVCVGTGIYRDGEGAMHAGAMELRWMENAEKVGAWLNESKDSVPIVRMVFPEIGSLDTLMSQLILLEQFMLKETGSADTMGEVQERMSKAYQTVVERLEEVEKETQEEK